MKRGAMIILNTTAVLIPYLIALIPANNINTFASENSGHTHIIPSCEKWTEFFDFDRPDRNLKNDPKLNGDFEDMETMQRYVPHKICEQPTAIDVRVAQDGRDYRDSGDIIEKVIPKDGFICRNDNQPKGKRCTNYEVRFCCPAVLGTCHDISKWSDWYETSGLVDEKVNASIAKIHALNPEKTCLKPTAIEIRLVGEKNLPYVSGNNVLNVSLDTGLMCFEAYQVYDGSVRDGLQMSCPFEICDMERLRKMNVARKNANLKTDSIIACKNYKVRLCCDFTVSMLMDPGSSVDAVPDPPLPDNELDLEPSGPLKPEEFFRHVESKFAFNDDDDFVTCPVLV